MNIKQQKQAGFTLVEIAIVLVIVGLLLGGVLKGQSMIENGKVKALSQEFTSMPTMLYGYQDKYKALPGDDPAAVAHQAGSLQATAATAGNGYLDTGTWRGVATAVVGNESSVFWNHVRLAGLANGAATAGEAVNAVGGYLGVSSTANATHITVPTNVVGSFITCSSGINGKVARILDLAVDDGVGTTGSTFGAVETAGPIVATTAAAAYNDSANTTVCQAF